MTLADIVKWAAWGQVTVKSISGFNNQGTDAYIQLHQTPPVTGADTAGTQLANGTVPAYKSLYAQANNGFYYELNVTLKELLVAISSTEVNFTAVSANTGLDMELDIDSQFACDGTERVVGDLSTGQNALQVWTEATGAAAKKRLLRLDIKDNQNTSQLVGLVYAVDTVQSTAPQSLVCSVVIPTKNATTTFIFGDMNSGLTPFQQDGGGTAAGQAGATYNAHYGCTINVTSETNGYWTAWTVFGGTAPNIRAVYK